MHIIKAGSRPSKKASDKWFTGIVWQDIIDDFPEEGWDKVLNTNLKSVFFLI